MKKSWISILLAVVLVSMFAVGCFAAEEYKFTGPVTLFITHQVGGTVDGTSRGIAPFLAQELGVNVIPQNREGAGGRTIRAEVFNRTRPDGYTILATGMPSLQLGELLFEGNYKTDQFTFIGNVTGTDSGVLLVAADSPINSLEDLRNLGEANCFLGSGGGFGSSDQLLSTMVREIANIQHRMIPYDGDAEMITAVLGHQITAGLTSFSTLRRFREQVKVLAIFDDERAPDIDAPTFLELGYEGMVSGSDIGIVAPPGLPEHIRKTLSDALARANANPEFHEWAARTGWDLNPLNSEEHREHALSIYSQMQVFAPIMLEEIAANQ